MGDASAQAKRFQVARERYRCVACDLMNKEPEGSQ